MKIIYLVLLSQLLSGVLPAQNVRQIDVNESVVKWEGSSLLFFHDHYGTVTIRDGILVTDGDHLTSGMITLDMTTIVNTDGEFNKGLVDHLKDPDFFDVANYKTANLEIRKVRYRGKGRLECEGDLTIKDITQPIRFYATEITDLSGTSYRSKLKIDRTKWNIKYQSKSFFDDLGDNAISDIIEFEVLIVTR